MVVWVYVLGMSPKQTIQKKNLSSKAIKSFSKKNKNEPCKRCID
jgi:hypothetical protein